MNFPIPVNLTVEELNQEQNLEFDSTIVVIPKLPEYIRYDDDITDVTVTRNIIMQGRPVTFLIDKTVEELRALITSQTRIRFISKIQTRYGTEDSPTVYEIVRFNPDAQQYEEFLALHTVDGNKGITLSFQVVGNNLTGTATEDEYYELPENGVPLSDLDPNVQDVINGAVLYNDRQVLTDSEQQAARTNINAQKVLEFDTQPIENSENPVTSGGLYNVFDELYNTLQDDYVRYNDDVIDVTINRQILPVPGMLISYFIRSTGDGIKALLNSQAKVRFNTSYNNDIYTLVSFNPDAQEEEVVLTLHKIDGNLETTLNFEIRGRELRATAVIDQFYELPDGGIPKETLDEGVRTSLEKADNSVQYVRQHLTTEQKAMARENIGALGTDRDVIRYIDDVVVVNITGGQAPLYRYYLSCTDIQLKGYMNSQTKVRFEYADCPCVVKYYDRNASSVYSNTLVVLECEVNNKIYTFTFAYVNGSLVGTLEVGAYYTLPSEGIPKSDLSSAVQSSLDLANNAVLFNVQTLTSAEQAQARTNIGAAAISDIGIVFKLKGEVQYVSDLPATGNRVGDVYFVSSEKVGYVWLETEEYPTGYWEQLGEPIDLSAYATLASPAFTGIPTAPTPSSGTNTSQLATAAFVQDAVTGLYTKPTDGIPLEDLTYDVQASISAIDDKIGYEDLYADRIFNVSGSKVQNLWTVDDIMEELNSGKIVRFFEYTEDSPSGVQLNRYQIMDTTLDSKIKIACILDDCVRFVDFVPVLDGDEYVYDGTVSVQSIGGTAMSAYDSTPLMDGVGSAGVLDTYARGDHRHPSDTSKAPAPYIMEWNYSSEAGGWVTQADAGDFYTALEHWRIYGVPIVMQVYAMTLSAPHKVIYFTNFLEWFDNGSDNFSWTTVNYEEWGHVYLYEFTFVRTNNGFTTGMLDAGELAWENDIPSVPNPANTTPKDLAASAAIGTSTRYARADHIHAKPTYTASDVGALPSNTTYVSAVNGQSGDVTLTVPSAATATPSNLGTAAVGSSGKFAREDHVHDFNSDFVTALLQIAEKVAYIDAGGQTYYDDLYAALYHRVLSSISAVFTQGGNTIWSDDSLDTLKQYLVVTAHYSDNTDVVLASGAYTLSGSMSTASSTITASYSGKTATFTVTVTPVGSTNYASSSMSNVTRVGGTGLNGVTDGVLWYKARNATDISNWSSWIADAKPTLWSVLKDKTVRVRITMRSPDWTGDVSDTNRVTMHFCVFANASVTSLGSTNRCYSWNLTTGFHPTTSWETYEYILPLDTNTATANPGTVTSSSTVGFASYAETLNTVEIRSIEVVEVLN